jgi:RNA-directed DNA polymerase
MNVPLRLNNRSRVKGDFYARICERLRGKFPGSTRLIILCKSKRSAERTLANIIPYIEKTLFLKVNREKTVVAGIREIKFLGYSFYVYRKEGRLRAHPRSIARMKERIKTLTSRSNGWGDARRKEELRQYIIGWVNYFKLADIKSLLVHVDEWYRRRLRMVIWKHWKRIRTRLSNLLKLGIPKQRAWEFANTRKGYWHTANSPILARTITTDRLYLAGYIFFTDYFRKVKSVN